MTGKIFRSTLTASLTVLLASLLVVTGCLYTYFGTVRQQQLRGGFLWPRQRWRRTARTTSPASGTRRSG